MEGYMKILARQSLAFILYGGINPNRPLVWLIAVLVTGASHSNFDFLEILDSIFWAIVSLWLIGYLSTDIFHVCNHKLHWLFTKWHWLHHSCFKRDGSIRNFDIFIKARWRHDFPETILMLLTTLSFIVLLYYLSVDGFYGGFYGCIHAVVGICNAVRIGCGNLDHFKRTDIGHQPQVFDRCPSEWFVNAAGHWRHHVDNVNTYFGGKTTVVDKILGTANSLRGRSINCSIDSKNLDCFLSSLNEQGAKIISREKE
jgi:monoglucosyldiacylglycerol epimerase